MSFRILLILIFSVAANLTWSFGNEVDSAVNYFVFPEMIAILVVFLWRSVSWTRQMLMVLGFLLFAEIVRNVFVLHAGRQDIFDDPDNRVFIIISFLFEIGISIFAYGVAKWLISVYEKPVV